MIDFKKLQAYFPPEDLEWRIGNTWPKGNPTQGNMLVYVTARAIYDRLDEVVGPENWYVTYEPSVNDDKNESVQATLWINITGDSANPIWIGKSDVGTNSNQDPVKGGYSDSVKRAASAGWGIGRYLYDFPFTVVSVDSNKKLKGKFDKIAAVPPEFLPEGYTRGGVKGKKAEQHPEETETLEKDAQTNTTTSSKPTGAKRGRKPAKVAEETPAKAEDPNRKVTREEAVELGNYAKSKGMEISQLAKLIKENFGGKTSLALTLTELNNVKTLIDNES